MTDESSQVTRQQKRQRNIDGVNEQRRQLGLQPWQQHEDYHEMLADMHGLLGIPSRRIKEDVTEHQAYGADGNLMSKLIWSKTPAQRHRQGHILKIHRALFDQRRAVRNIITEHDVIGTSCDGVDSLHNQIIDRAGYMLIEQKGLSKEFKNAVRELHEQRHSRRHLTPYAHRHKCNEFTLFCENGYWGVTVHFGEELTYSKGSVILKRDLPESMVEALIGERLNRLIGGMPDEFVASKITSNPHSKGTTRVITIEVNDASATQAMPLGYLRATAI